jgi:diguanylate cyclase (GGDEF)-like protein/PAS domain S-box-containing protein
MQGKLPEDQFHKQLIDNLYDGVYFVDTERRITYWNKGAERITGYLSEMVVGTFCNQNLLSHITDNGKQLCEDGCPLLETLRDGNLREAEVHLRHVEGHRVPVLIRTTPILDENLKIVGAVEVFSNNQSLFSIRRKVTELEKKAFYDALTGLSNRAFTEMKLRAALLEYHQHKLPFGLLFIDVDHFKEVNDTFGHDTGDKVLQTVARNLSTHLWDTDTCGRWGGDEFVVIVENVDARRLGIISEKLRAMISHSMIKIGEHGLRVTVSIGAALVHEDDSPETLIQRADDLMYQSKKSGRDCVTLQP